MNNLGRVILSLIKENPGMLVPALVAALQPTVHETHTEYTVDTMVARGFLEQDRETGALRVAGNETCDICRKRFYVEHSYHDYTCTHCGQVYEYTEGNYLKLTPEQLALLQKAHDEK
jgi:hypothetical protein